MHEGQNVVNHNVSLELRCPSHFRSPGGCDVADCEDVRQAVVLQLERWFDEDV